MPNNTPVQYPVCNCLYTCTHTCIVSQLSSIVSQFFCCCWFVNWQLTTSNNKRIEKRIHHWWYLPCARMCSRVMHLVTSVCVHVDKKRLFGAIPLKHLLSIFCYFLTEFKTSLVGFAMSSKMYRQSNLCFSKLNTEASRPQSSKL